MSEASTELVRSLADPGKWPRLLVEGDWVTEEQANEILIRTHPQYLFCNWREWEELACAIMRVPREGARPAGNLRTWWRERTYAWGRLRSLDLEYLTNNRVAAAYIGGPHGWCDWDGRIGCNSFNIGKWPGIGQVTSEWERIAAAFPFLRLRAQLVAEEGAGELAGTWDVECGRAVWRPEVRELCTPLAGPMSEEAIVFRFLFQAIEQGVDPVRLVEAVRQVRIPYALPPGPSASLRALE